MGGEYFWSSLGPDWGILLVQTWGTLMVQYWGILMVLFTFYLGNNYDP